MTYSKLVSSETHPMWADVCTGFDWDRVNYSRAGRGHSQSAIPGLATGVFHIMWCHAQYIKEAGSLSFQGLRWWDLGSFSIAGPDRLCIGQQVLSSHMVQDNEMIRSSQHGFTKGRSCLTNLISFYDRATCLLDEGKAVGVHRITQNHRIITVGKDLEDHLVQPLT